MTGRLALLAGSPRIAPGLLTRAAWQVLEQADAVLARDEDEPLAHAIEEAGLPVRTVGATAAPELARALVAQAAAEDVVWVVSADGDPGLTDAIASEVSRLPAPPEVEVVVGSWDVPGARLLDLVAVMDRLRSPGGCPWDAEQTHESLVKYLIEEAHEAAEAIESGDRDHMVEELGDVLLQVAFQSRVGEEHARGALRHRRRGRRHRREAPAAPPARVRRGHGHHARGGRGRVGAHQGEGARGEGRPRAAARRGTTRCSTAYRRRCPACSRPRRCCRAGSAAAETSRRSALTTDDLGRALLGLVARARERGESAESLLRAAVRDFAAGIR